jgi:DNA-binding transcriptional MerR regulator
MMLHMGTHEWATAHPDDEATGYIRGNHGESPAKFGEQEEGRSEGSSWVSTKQAAKALGVSRRMVQEYVRRGTLEAFTEGEGVSKTYYVSIDSLNALRERRGREANPASRPGEVASSTSDAAKHDASIGETIGAVLREAIERLEARTAEAAELKARLELMAHAESSLREALEQERARTNRLEAELREARSPAPGSPDSSETVPKGAAATEVEEALGETQETSRRRSWLYRFFFGA